MKAEEQLAIKCVPIAVPQGTAAAAVVGSVANTMACH